MIKKLINIYIYIYFFLENISLRDQWIRDGEGFLLVYSIIARSTFERVEKFRNQILRVKETDRVPMVLVGNKCDIINKRDISREEGYFLAKRLQCEFIETSAKTCANVEKAFYTVVRCIRAQRGGVVRKEGGSGSNGKKCSIL